MMMTPPLSLLLATADVSRPAVPVGGWPGRI